MSIKAVPFLVAAAFVAACSAPPMPLPVTQQPSRAGRFVGRDPLGRRRGAASTHRRDGPPSCQDRHRHQRASAGWRWSRASASWKRKCVGQRPSRTTTPGGFEGPLRLGTARPPIDKAVDRVINLAKPPPTSASRRRAVIEQERSAPRRMAARWPRACVDDQEGNDSNRCKAVVLGVRYELPQWQLSGIPLPARQRAIVAGERGADSFKRYAEARTDIAACGRRTRRISRQDTVVIDENALNIRSQIVTTSAHGAGRGDP